MIVVFCVGVPGACVTFLAQAEDFVVDDPLSTAEKLFGVAGVVGAIGSIAAIVFAGISLRQSSSVRREALAERRLDHAKDRLEGIGELSVLLRALDEAGRAGQYMTLIAHRTRISVLLAIHRLKDELPLTALVTDDTLYTGGAWQLGNAKAAVDAFGEIDAALEAESIEVRRLTQASLALSEKQKTNLCPLDRSSPPPTE